MLFVDRLSERKYEPLKSVFRVINLGDRINFNSIEKNIDIQRIIDFQDEGLIKSGELMNLHNREHCAKVLEIGTKLLMELGFKNNDYIIEDFKIAAMLHDVGNTFGRYNHGERGAKIAEEELLKIAFSKVFDKEDDFDRFKSAYRKYTMQKTNNINCANVEVFNQIAKICYGICVHSETDLLKQANQVMSIFGHDTSVLAAVLFIADKSDIRHTRTRTSGFYNEFKKVNLCVEKSEIEVGKNTINLKLYSDDKNLNNIYGSADKFINALMMTDGGKFIHCNRLSNAVLNKKFVIYIDDKMISIPKNLEDRKIITGNFKK